MMPEGLVRIVAKRLWLSEQKLNVVASKIFGIFDIFPPP